MAALKPPKSMMYFSIAGLVMSLVMVWANSQWPQQTNTIPALIMCYVAVRSTGTLAQCLGHKRRNDWIWQYPHRRGGRTPTAAKQFVVGLVLLVLGPTLAVFVGVGWLVTCWSFAVLLLWWSAMVHRYYSPQ